MAWKSDASGVLHWVDDPNSVDQHVYTAQDRWEDPGEGKDGGNDGGGDGGDSGGGDSGGGGNDSGGGDNSGGGNDSSGNDSGGGDGSDSSGGSGGGSQDSSGNGSDSSGNSSGSENLANQARDTWFNTQQQDDQQLQDNWNQNNNNFNQSWQQDQQNNRNSFASQESQNTPSSDNSGAFDEATQLYKWYQENGVKFNQNNGVNSDVPLSEQVRDNQTSYQVQPYQPPASALTPTTTNGSLFSTQTDPNKNYQPTTNDPATGAPTNYDPNTQEVPPPHEVHDTVPQDQPPPDAAAPQTVAGPDASTAATAAAHATAAAGGTPQDVAQAAALATRMVAFDNQTLDQQSSWTRQMFKSTYGDNADQEWARQHNAELQRNKGLYGSQEPRAGTAPVAGAPAGTPVAPNRTIGAVRPPGPNETGMYGINTPIPHPAASAAPANPSGVGPAVGPAPGTVPPHNAATDTRLAPAAPTGPATSVTSLPPAGPTRPTASALPAADEFGRTPASGGATATPPPAGPVQQVDEFGRTPASGGASTATGTSESAYPAADEFGRTVASGGAVSAPPGTLVAADSPSLHFFPDGSVRAASDGRIVGSYDPNNPPPNLIPIEQATQQPAPTMRGAGYQQASAVGRTGLENSEPTSVPSTPVPGVQSGSRVGDALPGDVTPVQDRVQQALDTQKPIDTLAQLAASTNPDANPARDAVNITNGIGAMLRGDSSGAWAEPYLNDVARLAWAREERGNGRTADPRLAPDDYIEHWKDAMFGGDPSVPMVKEMNQQMIDYAVDRTPPGKPFDWKQAFGPTGENGLISRQIASNDCGPNAFSTILRSRGYNADPTQTFAFAKQTGYHNGDEFTGPANMARMLQQEAGLDAKDSPIDWKTVDSELADGRPVVLSSPGHYWVVSARRDGANGPEYYAGATANVVSNPSWSSRGQFRYGGAVTDMITAKGDVDPNARAVRQMNLPVPSMSATKPDRAILSTAERATQRMSESMQPSQEQPSGGSVSTGPTTGSTGARSNVVGSNEDIQNGTTGRTAKMQDSIDNESDTNPTLQTYHPQAQTDPRIEQAANEDVWSNNQPARQALMQEFQAKPKDERQVLFENAMDQGLQAEGITGDKAEQWKDAMRSIAMGGPGLPAENPDLNPYMIAGESGGNPGTANRLNASSTGYFQLIHTKGNGSDFAYNGYLPKEYNGNWYDPVGQVRQFVRAINASTYHGDPSAAVADKRRKGTYSIIVQARDPY